MDELFIYDVLTDKKLFYDELTDKKFYSDNNKIKAACKEVAEIVNRSLEDGNWVFGNDVVEDVMKVLSTT